MEATRLGEPAVTFLDLASAVSLAASAGISRVVRSMRRNPS
jgi:hypothetical protein